MKTAWRALPATSKVNFKKTLDRLPATPACAPRVWRTKRGARRKIYAAQDLYGQAADATRDTAVTVDRWLRHTIETQPYTSALVALGIGWVTARLHRPL
jgi:hypothetical protein